MRDSHKVDARPSFQFYPNDWLTDTGLQLCSLGAQGLWMRMLCLMWSSPERGRLLGPSSKRLRAKQLASLVNAPEADVKQMLSELKAHSVYSTSCGGVIYNRRMLRDEKQRLSKVAAGRLGGMASKTQAERGSSSSSSTSTATTVQKSTPNGVVETGVSPPSPKCPHQEIGNAWNDLAGEVGLSKVRVPLSEARKRKLKSRWAEWEKISVRNGWQGIWRSIAEGIRQSAFLLGENDRGWKITFDWLVRNGDNWQKLLEGQYQNRDPAKKVEPL